MHNRSILIITGILEKLYVLCRRIIIWVAKARKWEVILATLEELGHKQLTTPIITNNYTASDISKDAIKLKISKYMDMEFYWISNYVTQKHFIFQFIPVNLKLADYYTKHHS